jgi:hypothetical protein
MPTQKSGRGFLKFGAFVFIGLFLVGKCVSDADQKVQHQAALEKAWPTCKSDFHLCKDNSDLANHYEKMSDAQFNCYWQAKDMAKYGEPKFETYKFPSFLPGETAPKDGRLILIDTRAQFQNGFGAWVHSRVACNYDFSTGTVLNVSINGQ